MCILFYFIILLGSFAPSFAQTNDPLPRHESFTVKSKILNEERVINIWMPDSFWYAKRSELPVVYLLDGGVDEDFAHIANTFSELIAKKEIEAIVLVGIENTQRRRDLTGETSVKKDKKIAPIVGKSADFRLFIEKELIPAVKQNYRLSNNKGIMGESLAGLFVVETFLLQPGLFNFYLAFDPSLWWNNGYLAKNAFALINNTPERNQQLWISASNAKDIYKNTRKFNQQQAKTLPKKDQFFYFEDKKQTHSTIFRAHKEQALKWVLPYKSNSN
jgi:uncharacterized protein